MGSYDAGNPYPPPPIVGLDDAVTRAVQAMLASAAPMQEARQASAGTASTVSRQDHQHPRLTSSTTGTTDANGLSTVTFTRTFTTTPSITITAVENSNAPSPTFKVKSWVQDANGTYTGCVIYGTRDKLLPTLTAGILLTALASTLSNYAPYDPAANVSFTIIAVQSSAT